MSGGKYLEKIKAIISKIQRTQLDNIEQAAELMAQAIGSGNRVYLFGSGHSVIPVMDVFPRYGSFVGFYPLYDPRLMWHSVIGPGGARELLWIERQEGYEKFSFESYDLRPGDVIIVFLMGDEMPPPSKWPSEPKPRSQSHQRLQS